jgi:dihydrofolate reductase
MTNVTMIAAVGRNNVIGDGTSMPWHLPDDLQHFKATTLGHTMIMGRRTFETIGRVLPGRRTIVITRQPDWRHPGVETAHSLADALFLAGPGDEVFVVGGGEVYREAMPYAARLVITHVDQEPPGSVTFPAIDPATWEEAEREEKEGFSIVTYTRRG